MLGFKKSVKSVSLTKKLSVDKFNENYLYTVLSRRVRKRTFRFC